MKKLPLSFRILAGLVAAATGGILRADVVLPPVFGDHAVLQQGAPAASSSPSAVTP